MSEKPESPFDFNFPRLTRSQKKSDSGEPANLLPFGGLFRWLGRRGLAFWEIFVCLSASMTLLAFLARWWWPFELASHFRVQYLGVLCFAICVQYARSKPLTGFLFLVLTVVNFGACFSLLPITNQELPQSTPNLRCLWVNVNTANNNYARVLELIEETEPDVVVLGEVNKNWMKGISELEEQYRLVCSIPREDNFGVAMFSRVPAVDVKTPTLTPGPVPAIVATLDVDGTLVSVIGAHTFPPVGSHSMRARNQQLDQLGELCQQLPGHRVLVGDLNLTSWSPYFQDLETKSSLRDSRTAIGIQPTWHTGLWFACIPIDHCLVSSEIEVIERRVESKVGSDHLPILIDLAVPVLE